MAIDLKKGFTFIDLFAGIGGFHQAMANLGGRCVFASEIDGYAIETYMENYGINSAHNIVTTNVEDIPKHDVLCAGFPCQAFSKAGKQQGFKDLTKGTLFFDICRILEYHKPPYIILENVRNLVSHDKGETWKVIKKSLIELGYVITETPIVISPHQLGIPQLRERVVILGVHRSTGIVKLNIDVPSFDKENIDFLKSGIIENSNVDSKYYISKHEERVLNCWNDFINGIEYVPCSCKDKNGNKKYYSKPFSGVIGFPIWAFEFGCTYDYKFDQANNSENPDWKQEFILKNRLLYEYNKAFIDQWLDRWDNLSDFSLTEKKFEWQCGRTCNSVWEALIQFRPSGIRVKSANVFPALVAIVQIPIIGSVKRRLTPREAARLQSFPDDFIINRNDHQAYKQFGNAVNVKVIQFMADQLFKQ